MTTVLVRSADGHADITLRGWSDTFKHVHFQTNDLAKFLNTIRLKAA
jgi:hypothetical protein